MPNHSRKLNDDDSTQNRYRKGDVGSTSSTFVIRLKDGDAMAWETFVNIYSRLVRVWCRRANNRFDEPLMRDDRKEITAVVIEKVQKTLMKQDGNVPEIRSLRGWLRTITENCIKDYVKQRQERKPVWQLMSDTGHFKEPYNIDMSLDLTDEHAEKVQILRGVLKRIEKKIKPDHWAVLQLLGKEGMDSVEIAKILNMNEDAVRQIKKRLPDRIRREYEKLGLEDEMLDSIFLPKDKRSE